MKLPGSWLQHFCVDFVCSPRVFVFFLPLFKDMLPVDVVECVGLILLVKSKACTLMHQYQESRKHIFCGTITFTFDTLSRLC